MAPRGQRRQLRRRQHAARRVRRTGHDQPRDLAAQRVEQRRRRLKPRFDLRRDTDRHDIERLQDIAIRRVAGIGERHLVAGIERGEETEQERARRAGGDNDALDRHIDAVFVLVMTRDARAQHRHAEGFGIAQPLLRQRARRGVTHQLGRGRAGLSHFQMDGALRRICRGMIARIGGAHHIHDDERRDAAAPRGLECHGARRQSGPAAKPNPRRSARNWQVFGFWTSPSGQKTALTRPSGALGAVTV